jgi:hypothetical protein
MDASGKRTGRGTAGIQFAPKNVPHMPEDRREANLPNTQYDPRANATSAFALLERERRGRAFAATS